MKRVRGVLLPLLLCGLILAAGVCAPALFGAAAPDYKDAPETVSLAGTSGPLYVAPDADIVFAPWDILNRNRAKPATRSVLLYEGLFDDYARRAEQTLALLPADFACTADGTELFENMILDEQIMTLYLEDYPAESKSGPIFIKMAIALDSMGGIPLYFSFTAENGTEPHPYPLELETNFNIAAELWTTSYPRTDIAAMLAEANYADSTVIAFINFFTMLDELPVTEDGFTCASPWNVLLNDRKSVYAFNYRNQSCILIADSQNRMGTLFFDQKTRSVTGFSLDPALVNAFYIAYFAAQESGGEFHG